MSSNTLNDNSLSSNSLYTKTLPNYFIFNNEITHDNTPANACVRVLSDYLNYTNIVHKENPNKPLAQTCLFLLQKNNL